MPIPYNKCSYCKNHKHRNTLGYYHFINLFSGHLCNDCCPSFFRFLEHELKKYPDKPSLLLLTGLIARRLNYSAKQEEYIKKAIEINAEEILDYRNYLPNDLLYTVYYKAYPSFKTGSIQSVECCYQLGKLSYKLNHFDSNLFWWEKAVSVILQYKGLENYRNDLCNKLALRYNELNKTDKGILFFENLREINNKSHSHSRESFLDDFINYAVRRLKLNNGKK